MAIFTAVGIGLAAYGTYRGLRAEKSAAKHNAQIARTNAAIKKERIKDVRVTGARLARQIERETIDFIGDQVTAFASGGVDISSGVVSEAVEGTARSGAADIIELQSNIEKDVWGLEVGIMSDEMSAAFSASRARRLKRAAPIAAGTTLLTGIGGLLAAKRTEPTTGTGGGEFFLNRPKRFPYIQR